MLALDPAQEGGAAWQPGGPAGRAGLSDIDETRLDELTQSRGQRPSTLFVDKPAVETTSVQLQTLESRELSRAVCLGGIGERGDHWCRVTGEDRISTLLNGSLDRASRVVPALPAPAGEPLQGALDHSPSLLEWASNWLRVALARVQLHHGPRDPPSSRSSRTTTHSPHARRYSRGVSGRYRSYGASHSSGATRPCSADRMNHGSPSLSAYARAFRNRADCRDPWRRPAPAPCSWRTPREQRVYSRVGADGLLWLRLRPIRERQYGWPRRRGGDASEGDRHARRPRDFEPAAFQARVCARSPPHQAVWSIADAGMPPTRSSSSRQERVTVSGRPRR